MVALTSLLIPILLAAVLVFIASAVIHMVLPYHRADFGKVPDEAALTNALRNVPPGDYMMPHGGGPEAMKDPAFVQRMNAGPNAVLTVMKPGNPMGTSLAWWFVFCLVVSIFAAYVAGRAADPGDQYMSAFRFASVTAFLGYGMANWSNTIWYKQKASTQVKNTIDSLLYGLLTGGAIAWGIMRALPM